MNLLHIIQKYSLYLFFFSINFEMWDPLNTNIGFFTTKVTFVLYILTILPELKSLISIKSIKKFIYPIFALFILLTYMNYINRSTSFPDYFDLLFFFNLILLVSLLNHQKREPKLLLKCLFAFAISSIVMSIMYYLRIETGYGELQYRMTIFNMNQNDVGLKLVISMFIFVSIINENGLKFGKFRFFFYLFFPLIFIFIIETASRVAFISLLLGVIVFFILYKKRFSLNKLLILVSLTLIIYLVMGSFLQNSYLFDRLLKSADVGDLSYRDVIWEKGLQLVSDNLIFGQGQTGYAGNIYSLLGFVISPHNVFIEILCYTGVVGLILFIIFLIQVIKCAIKSHKVSRQILPVILLIPIFGMLLSGQILGTKIAWVLVIFIISPFAIQEENKIGKKMYDKSKISELSPGSK